MRLHILLLIAVWGLSSCEDTSKHPSKNYKRTIKHFNKGPTIFSADFLKNDFPKKVTTVKGNGAKFTSNIKDKVKSFSSTSKRKRNDENTNFSSKKEFSSEISTFFKNFKKKGLFDQISKLVQDLNDVTNYKIITEQAKRRWAIPNPNILKKNNILNSDSNDLASIPASKKDTISVENNEADDESKTYIKNAKFLRDLTDLADYETWQASQNDDRKLTVPQMKQLVSNFFKLKDNDIGDSTPSEEIERFIKELNDSTNAEIKAAEDINRIRRNQTLGISSDEYSQDNKIVEDLPTKKDKLFSYSSTRNVINDNYLSDGLNLNNEDFNAGNGISTPNIYSTQNDYETRLGNYLNEDRKKNLSFASYLNNATSNVPIDLNDLNNAMDDNNNNDKYSTFSNKNADEGNTDLMNIDSAVGKTKNASDEVYSRMVTDKGFEPGINSENGSLDSDDNQNDYDDDDYLGVADNDEGSDVVDGRDRVRSGDIQNLNTLIDLSKKEEKNESSIAKTSITNAVRNVLNVVEDTDNRNNGLNKGNSSLVIDKSNNDIPSNNSLVDTSLTEVDTDKLQKAGFVTEQNKLNNNTQNSSLIDYNHFSNDNNNHNGNNDKKNDTNPGEITRIVVSPFVQKQAKVFTDLMKSEIDSVLKEDLVKHSNNFVSSNDSKLKNASDMNTIDEKKYAYPIKDDEDDFKQRKFDWKNHPNIYLKSLNKTTSGRNDTVSLKDLNDDNASLDKEYNNKSLTESSRSLNNSFSNPGISLGEPNKSSTDSFTFGQPDSLENIERKEMSRKWFNYTTAKSTASNLHDSSDVFVDDDVDDIADDNDGGGNFIENDDDDNTVEFLNAGNNGKSSVIDVSYPSADQDENVLDKMDNHNGKSAIDNNSDEKLIVNEIKDSNIQTKNKNMNNFFGKTKLTNDALNSKVSTYTGGKNEVDKATNRIKLQNGTLNFIKKTNKTAKIENGDDDRFVQGIEGDTFSSNTKKERAKEIGGRFLKGVAGDAKRLSNMSLFIADDEQNEDESKQIQKIDQPLKKCNMSVCDKRATATRNVSFLDSDKFLNNIEGDKGHESILKNYDSNVKNDNFLKGVEGDAKMVAKVEQGSRHVIGPLTNEVNRNEKTAPVIGRLLNDSKSLLMNAQNSSTNVKKFNNTLNIFGDIQLDKNSDTKMIDYRVSNVSSMAQPQIDNENDKKFSANTDQMNAKKFNNTSNLVDNLQLDKNSDVKRIDYRVSNVSLLTPQPRIDNENGTSLNKEFSTNTTQRNADFQPLNTSSNLEPDNNLNQSTSISNIASLFDNRTTNPHLNNGTIVNLQRNELREMKNGDGGKAFADDFVDEKSQLLATDRFLIDVDGDQKKLNKVNGENIAKFGQSNRTQNMLKNCSGDCPNSLIQYKADRTDNGRPVGAANEDVYGKNDDNDLIKEMAMEEVKALSRIKYNKDLLKDSADLQRRYYAELKSLDPEIARADLLSGNVNSGLVPLDVTLRSLKNESKKIPIIGTPRGDLNTFEINGLNYHNLVRNIHGVPNMKIDKDLSERAERRAKEIAAEAGGSSTDSITQRPGENVFIGCYSGNLTAMHATKKWYNEICLHGYDFDEIGPQFGTNQFAQVVWKESTILGIGREVATAQNGTNCTYIVALYKEIGNKMGSYKKNVKKGTFSTQTCKDLNKLFPGDESIVNQYSHVKRRTVDVINQEIGAESNFAEEGLRVHNVLREIHGSQKMKLDLSLVNAANEYAMKLASQDLSEAIPENSGENVFTKCGLKLVTAPEAISKWYSEICGFNFDDPSNEKGKRSHFKRVIRQTSNLFGMGIASKKLKNGTICSFVVARYNPPEDDLGSANIYKGHFTSGMCSNIDELTSPKKSTVNGEKVDNMMISSEDDGDDVSSISPFVEDGFIAHNRYRTVHNSTLISIDPLLSKFAREKAKELSEMDPGERINTQPGENIYVRCAQKPSTAKEAVDTWYSEVCDSPSYGFNKRDEIQSRSHFAQVIWDRSTVFGMGRANKKAANGSICSYIVARYNPPGNSGSIKENIRKGTFNKDTCKDLSVPKDTERFAVPLNDIAAKRSPRKKENRNLFFHERLEGDDEEDDEEEDLKSPVLSSFEKEALKTHNAFRQLHGSRELNIDILLSDKAQNDADRLANGVVSEEDLMSAEGKVGLNTLVRCAQKPVSARTATEAWYREVCTDNYDFSKPHYKPNAEHFTQLIWNKTSLLGIGSVTKKIKNGSICSYIVAHYNPPGNQGNFRKNVFKGSFTDKVCIDIAGHFMSSGGDAWLMKVTDAEKPEKKNSTSGLYETSNFEDDFFLEDTKETHFRNFTENKQNDKDINEKKLKNFTEISSRDEVQEKIRLKNLTKNVFNDSIFENKTQNIIEDKDAEKTELNEKITSPFLGNNTEKVELDNFAENSSNSFLEAKNLVKFIKAASKDGKKLKNHTSKSFGDEGATRA